MQIIIVIVGDGHPSNHGQTINNNNICDSEIEGKQDRAETAVIIFMIHYK